MAEFLEQKAEQELSGMNALGHPVPDYRKHNGYMEGKSMGLSSARSMECVSSMCEAIRRDMPYEAIQAGMKHLDLTGTYRMLAVLMVSEEI